MKKSILALGLLAPVMSFAQPPAGIYKCSDIGGKNPMHITVTFAPKPSDVRVIVGRPGKPTRYLPLSRVEMSEEEENEYSVWFLNERGERRSSNPDTYCSILAFQG